MGILTAMQRSMTSISQSTNGLRGAQVENMDRLHWPSENKRKEGDWSVVPGPCTWCGMDWSNQVRHLGVPATMVLVSIGIWRSSGAGVAFWIVPSLEGPRNRSSDLPEKSSGTAIASSLPIEP